MKYLNIIKKAEYGQIIAAGIITYYIIQLIRSFSTAYISPFAIPTFRLLLVDVFVTLIAFGIGYIVQRRSLYKENIVAFYVVIFTFIYALGVGIYMLKGGYSELGFNFDYIAISFIIATVIQRLMILPLQKNGYLVLRNYAIAVIGSYFVFTAIFLIFGFLVLIPILGNDVPNHTAAQIISSLMAIIYYFISSIYLPIRTKNNQ